MRIAFITSAHRWGGVKTWMLEFAEELRRQGDEVLFFARDAALIAKAKERDFQGKVMHFGGDYSPATILSFLGELRLAKVDVCCMNITKELRTAGVAARLLGIPVVWRSGSAPEIRNRFHMRFTWSLWADKMLVPGESMRTDILNAVRWIAPEDITTIHNGRSLPEQISLPSLPAEGNIRFAIVGKLQKEKGVYELLEAFSTLHGEHPATELIFVGEGPAAEDLKKRTADLGLSGAVHFTGFRNDVPEILRSCHFGVLASHMEGFPNVVLEQLSAGLPVVATRINSVPEIVTDGENGFLVEPKSAESLADGLRRALALTAESYAALSLAAVNTVRTRFNRSIQGEKLHTYFQSVVDSQKGY